MMIMQIWEINYSYKTQGKKFCVLFFDTPLHENLRAGR